MTEEFKGLYIPEPAVRLNREEAEAKSNDELKRLVIETKRLEAKRLNLRGRRYQINYLTGEDMDVYLAGQCRLANTVFEAVLQRTSTFEDVAEDLAYLLGAIVRNHFVEWERADLPELHDLLRDAFPIEHPVWSHIAIMSEERQPDAAA